MTIPSSRPGQSPENSRSIRSAAADALYRLAAKLPNPARHYLWVLLLRKYAYSHNLFRTRHSDVFFLSFPKSGRTWVRMMLGRYLAQLMKLDVPDLVHV